MMMMAAPEPEFELATSRSRVNQDPATLSRPELRYGNYLPQLARGRRLLDSHETAAAPAPEDEAELVMSTERGRLGGRTGMNFGTGNLYTQNRYDDRRRRQLLDSHEAAPAPEMGEMDLTTTRARLAFAPGRSFDAKDSPALLAALGNVGRRRQLLDSEAAAAAAPAPAEEEGTLELATERGRLG